MEKFLVATFFVLLCPILVWAYTSPGNPTGFVNDYAGMMSNSARTQLNDKLTQFEKDSSNEISVVTINSLQNDTIENFANKLFEQWQIGKKDKDNGVLLLIAKEDRQMRIEMGYGLEGALTDAQSFWIIQDILKPDFQAGNYDQGINNAVDKIIAATKGEYVPSENQKTAFNLNLKNLEVIFGFGFLAVVWLGAILGRSKTWWAGGVIGAVIGVILLFAISKLTGIIAIAILTPLGLLFDFLVSKTYKNSKDKGIRPPWWAGGGGFGKSGGFGGGGFGGFGGGHSGGGGSSGRW